MLTVVGCMLTTIIIACDSASITNGADLDWWQTNVIYQIYPRSFKDSNNDGIGDLKGIEDKIDYFVNTGIGIVWLSPIFKSPMIDFGYDVSDFKQIDPIFGSLDDFVSLKNALHAKGIRLMLDFVPNHSSDQHDWFKKSKLRIDPYTDYYIWRDPVSGKPPNSWVSVFGGSAWEWVPERQQYYYHAFAIAQPDLNYRNDNVKQEMRNVIKFWLDTGVDGYRFDAVPFLVEDINLRDEMVLNNSTFIMGYPLHANMNHNYTINLPETYDMLADFRRVLDEYKAKDGKTRFMLTEAYANIEDTMKYYGNESRPIGHMTFNFQFITDLNASSKAKDFDNSIHAWIDNVPDDRWSNWVVGNHDNHRIANRFGCNEMVDALNMISMLLPGTPVTYNEDEIGMVDGFISWAETVDVQGINAGPQLYQTLSRDPERTPFQWDSTINAGFNKGTKPWLPVNPNFWELNLESQANKSRSHYGVYKELIKLRVADTFTKGELQTSVVSEFVFAFMRILNCGDQFLFVVNLGSDNEKIRLKNRFPLLRKHLQVYVASVNSEYNICDVINVKDGFTMRPKSSLVLG